MRILRSLLKLHVSLSRIYLPFFICVIMIISVIPGEAWERKTARSGGGGKGEKQSPRDLIRLDRSDGYVLLVEKKSQQLFIYNSRNSLVKSINVTTGMRQGDKERPGDKKTPEGIYFFSEVKKDDALLPQYGVMALTTNYPNVIDQRDNKRGDGIWLHATDQPKRAFKQFDTLGCVVVLNEDIIDISKYVDLEITPIVIEDEVHYVSESTRKKLEKKIVDIIYRWRKAWEEKNIDDYMALYSDQFRLDAMDKKAFRAHKEKLNRRYDRIEVSLECIDIIMHREYTVASFIQRYKSNLFKTSGYKRLYFVPEHEEYKIIGEEWREVKVKEPSQPLRREPQKPIWKEPAPPLRREPVQPLRREPAKPHPPPRSEPSPAAVAVSRVKEHAPINTGESVTPGDNLEQWVRSKNPSHYTFQLLGVSSEEQILSFITQHGLKGKAGFIKTRRNGKDWFLLIYGEYRNMKEAKSAMASLPEYLRDPLPWIRNFKSVQESMDEN